MGPIFALGPSQGVPKELREPILSHLGRVPFSTLILDPQNDQKSSISRVPEPRKLHWRLDGSAISTFSQPSRPTPKIVDFGSFFGSLLGSIWRSGCLVELPGTSLKLPGHLPAVLKALRRFQDPPGGSKTSREVQRIWAGVVIWLIPGAKATGYLVLFAGDLKL